MSMPTRVRITWWLAATNHAMPAILILMARPGYRLAAASRAIRALTV